MWRPFRMFQKQRPSDATPTAHRRWRRIRSLVRFALWAVLVIAPLLVVARLLLPGYVERFVNDVLDRSPAYDGRIGRVHLALWRGAYTIDEVVIVKTTNAVPVPLFDARRVELSLDWRSLLHGTLRGTILIDRPRLNFVDGPSDEERQTGGGGPWLGMIESLFPFRIDRAELRDGEVHFQAFHTEPQVDISIEELNGVLTNLSNVEGSTEQLVARATLTGRAMGSGRFRCDLSLDPDSHRPTFDLAASLRELKLVELNDFSRAYGGFDYEAGRFDLIVEVSSKDGYMTGYAKPLLRGADVLGAEDRREDGPLGILWEGVVGLAEGILTNPERTQFGTRFGFEGTFENPRTSLLEIIGNVLRNAFIEAFLPRLERTIATEAFRVTDEDVTTMSVEGESP